MTTSLSKKLLAYHLARLKDKNPAVRVKSIQELQELGDIDALDALREVFKTDPDIDVRKAAQAAGLAIYSNPRKDDA